VALGAFFDASKGTLLDSLTCFRAARCRRLTIFALGIMPYIDAAIILELLKVLFRILARLAKRARPAQETDSVTPGTVRL